MNAASSITGQNGQGYAIFWITNCSGLVPIGLDGYPLNVIHGYTGLGVLSDASRVCIQHTQMSGAGGFWSINAPWQSGVGVLAQANSDVCIHGLGFAATSPFTFTSYPKAAVYADNSTLRCYNSFIQRVWRFGIQVHNTKNHWFDIANNRLIANGSGLGLSTAFVISTEKGTSGNSHIRGNIIDQMNNSLNGAIRVPDGSSSQTLLEIESNDITFHTGKGTASPSGIEFMAGNSSNNNVLGNHLRNTSNNTATGITFTSTVGSPGVENRIHNNRIGETLQQFRNGINITATPNASVCANQLLQTSNGINFTQNCMNTQVGANLFASTSLIGLGLNGNGINLGLNELQANRWEGTFTTLAAQHTGSDPQFSAFLVNDNPALPCGDPDYWPNSAGTPSVTPSWFKHVPGCPHACGIQTLVGGGDNSLDNLDLAIINGTYAQTGQSPVSIWNSRYTEYQKIANNPSVFGSNAQANAYLNSLQGMPIAQFYGIEQLLARA